jgi:alkylhydroperoxidase family enzyme
VLVQAVFADYTTAPIEDRLKATLGLIHKTTLAPHELSKADIDAVRATGASEVMIEEALHICALFNMIVRVADSLDFEVPSLDGYGEAALQRGYDL